MMVEQSRPVNTVGSFLKNLDNASTKLTEIGGKSQISPEEMKELMKTLNKVNDHLSDPTLITAKKMVPEKVDASIERALIALALFQRVGHRNVEQAITSLFSSLNSTLNDLGKNLRTLRKHRIGKRVEKTGESKGAS